MNLSEVMFCEPSEEQSDRCPQDKLDLQGRDTESPHQSYRKPCWHLVNRREKMGDDAYDKDEKGTSEDGSIPRSEADAETAANLNSENRGGNGKYNE
jgi:hypothetical protein